MTKEVETIDITDLLGDINADPRLPDPTLLMFYKMANDRRIWFDFSVDDSTLDYERMIFDWNMEDKGKPIEERKPIWMLTLKRRTTPMKFERTEAWGFDHALRGMRNPLASHARSDSHYDALATEKGGYIIGPNDMKLAQGLIVAGPEHRKFLRQIFVSVDITAPLYWWKEFDTYKVGTVANSYSTMHKLADTPITQDCFEMDDYVGTKDELNNAWLLLIGWCEILRSKYLDTHDKRYWKELIRLLPESWLQTRTVTMNYENVRSMVSQRRQHKLNEWSGIDDPTKPNFISWAASLPYAKELIFYGLDDPGVA